MAVAEKLRDRAVAEAGESAGRTVLADITRPWKAGNDFSNGLGRDHIQQTQFRQLLRNF
jgi:hypothetical protein